MFDEAFRTRLITAVANRIIAHAEELTALDSAIGDADHGLNMKRGFEAVLAELPKTVAQPLPAALNAVGMTMVMKVGGASGPLYGTLFMTLGKTLPAEPAVADVAKALDAAIAAVKARGKAEPGNKTMLDVLIPVQATLAAAGGGPELIGKLRETAAAAAQSTIPMLAIRGRASFLGERSIGHMDPGSRSSQLIVEAVCDVIEGKA